MQLSPMRYKGYTWPHNPRVYTIDFTKKMAAQKVPFGLYHLQDLGQTNRIMEGEGEFVGPDAYAQIGQLANVYYEKGPGLLVHPLWQAANAYFVSLRLEQEPRPDYVRYSFVFWEDASWYTGLTTRTAGAAQTQGAALDGGSGTAAAAAPVYHRVVRGDTLWGISQFYGVGLAELIALNPQIKNPNLIRVGDEVRVR